MTFATVGWTKSIAGVSMAVGLAAGGAAWSQQQPTKAAANSAAFRAATGSYQLAYDVDLLGAHVITLGVDLAIGRDAYDVTAQIKTVGFANWLFSWTQQISSQGTLTAAALQPLQHRMTSEFRGRHRSAEIDYADGKVAKVRVDPAPRTDDVSEAQRARTRDPISAVIGLIYAANQGQGCNTRAAVFDGRRRYDLVGSELPRGRDDGPAAAGARTLACSLEFQRIAGELRKPKADDTARREPNDTARVWMAPVEALNAMAPVRIEFDSGIGTMNLVLREANFSVDVASGPRSRPPVLAR